MGLNRREIVVIAETNRDNYSVEISSIDGGLWQAAIKIVQPEKHYEIVTSRGDLKTWRNLADAITFIQDACNDCKYVIVNIGAWKFSRVI